MSARWSAPAHGRRIAHLAARFFASLRARPLDAATVASVTTVLEPAERRVWEAMGRADQAESVAVYRRLEHALAGEPEGADGRWSAAALLHDAGKQCAGYGTLARVVVTAIAAVAGAAKVRAWSGTGRSVGERMGRYVAHDDLGAALLRDAGARSEVAGWAGAHHRPERWAGTGIPLDVCRALAAADGEPVDAEPGRNFP
jgi:hypothetical protein